MYYLYGQNTTVYFHTECYTGYTTTFFGPVYWSSSGFTVNLTSSYTMSSENIYYLYGQNTNIYFHTE